MSTNDWMGCDCHWNLGHALHPDLNSSAWCIWIQLLMFIPRLEPRILNYYVLKYINRFGIKFLKNTDSIV